MEVRRVNKFIIFIKATRKDGASVLLNYMSEDWRMTLFPNCPVPDLAGGDNGHIAEVLSKRFGMSRNQIEVNVDRHDALRRTVVEKPTNDPEKAKKYGSTAIYTFHYVSVLLHDPPPEMRREHFAI